MKFCFVAPIYGLRINKNINAGLRLGKMNISNTKHFLSNSVLKEPFKSVLGTYLTYDFYDDRNKEEINVNTHFYFEGNMSGFTNIENLVSYQMEKSIATKLVCLLLMESQSFLKEFWLLRDNSIYIRDGFACFYPDNNDFTGEARVFKYSLKEIFSDSKGLRDTVEFQKHEIVEIYNKNNEKYRIFLDLENMSYKNVEIYFEKITDITNLFSKETKLTNIEKSKFFISMAREQTHSDMKIFGYISSLEALFNINSASEIAHQIAERCALILGTNSSEKLEIFSKIKKAYEIRSKVVHGSTYKKISDDILVTYSKFLDDMLRVFHTEYLNIFEKNEEEMRTYFNSLIFD